MVRSFGPKHLAKKQSEGRLSKVFEKFDKRSIALIGLAVLIVLVIIVVFASRSLDSRRRKETDARVVEEMTQASKVAMTCFQEGGSVSIASPGLEICDKPNVAGNWPTLGDRSTDGTKWSYASSGQAGDDKVFTAIATTSGSDPFVYTCTVIGCVKSGNW